MTLKLVIRARGKGGLGTKSSCLFGTEGGTIGRGRNNTWVLADPRNEVSGHHATITYEGNQFCLTDESTNGVFMNGSANPLGSGVKIALRHGDAMRIGHYEIVATMGAGSEDPALADLSVADGYGLADLMVGGEERQEDLLEEGGARGVGYESFAMGASDLGETTARRDGRADEDPLKAFDSPQGGRRLADWRNQGERSLALTARPPTHGPATEEDTAGGVANNFSPRVISPGPEPLRAPRRASPAVPPSMPIPKGGFDDYLEGLGEEAVARDLGTRVVPREARVAADRGIDGIDGAMSTLSPSNHNLWPLLEGLGLTHTPIPDEKVADFLMDVGLALRQVIEGLHGVFSDQDQGGDATFRVATSQLQPLEDNPLKFAADADEAVDLLFGQRRAVHLGPRAAVAECLEGLRLHRSAVAAGTAEGLRTVIESFAPTTLARRFAKYDPSRADTRDSPWLWAMYEQYFEEVLRNRTHGLTRLFQEVLTQTYDRHIRDAMAPAREADDQRGQASFQTMT